MEKENREATAKMVRYSQERFERVDSTYNINLAVDRMHWRGIVEAALDLNGLF